MAGLEELAKQIGIQLSADAVVAIINNLTKLKKKKKGDAGGKTVSDQDKIAVIKAYVSKKPTMREVAGEKGGGYIKKYAKGSIVRKPGSY